MAHEENNGPLEPLGICPMCIRCFKCVSGNETDKKADADIIRALQRKINAKR